MAKLPNYQQGQRLDSTGPQQVVSPAGVRAPYENIEAAGKQLQGFSSSLSAYSEYLRQKKRADEAIFMKTVKDRSDRQGQDAETRVRTNVNPDGTAAGVKIDGSNMVEMYDESFRALHEEYSQEKDPRKRRIALNTIGASRNIYRGQVAENSRAVYNSWMFSEVDKSNKAMGSTILNDPQMYGAKLAEQREYIMSLPLGVDNQQKLLKEVEKDATLSLMGHFTNKGDFKTVKKLIGSEIGAGFNEEERQALLEKNEGNSREFDADRWGKEDRDAAELAKRKAQDRDNTMSTLFTMAGSQDPDVRANVVQEARKKVAQGILKKEDLNALQVESREILKDVSDNTYFSMTQRLKRKENLSTFSADISTAVARKVLDPNDARNLLNDYNTDIKSRKSSDKAYTEKLRAGRKLLDGAFNPGGPLAAMQPKQTANWTEATRIMADLMGQGMDPTTAAVRALEQVDPSNPILLNKNIAKGAGFDPGEADALQKQAATTLNNYDKKSSAKQLSEKDKRKIKKMLMDLKRRRNALEHEATIREVMEKDKKKGK